MTRRPPWGWLLLGLAATLAVTGVLPGEQVRAAWHLGWPVLAFLVLVKPVADLCGEAGLFSAAADRLARVARGSGTALFWLFCGLATLTTMFLSLDTTAVLVTPVGVVLARRWGLDPLPFAFAAIWLANSASLLLPISNLTNLMVAQSLGQQYLRLAWAPQLGVLAVSVGVLWLRWRGRVGRRLVAPPGPVQTPRDPVLLGVSGVVAGSLGPLLVLGLPAWAVAGAALMLLWSVFAVRRHPAARPGWIARQLPLEVAAAVLGLFWLVSPVSSQLTGWLGVPDAGPGGVLLVAGAGAGLANAVNNLPAFLALRPWAEQHGQLMALLVGVDVGPSLLLWGSLANILWWQSCRRHGVHISPARFAGEGLALVPVAVCCGALLTGG